MVERCVLWWWCVDCGGEVWIVVVVVGDVVVGPGREFSGERVQWWWWWCVNCGGEVWIVVVCELWWRVVYCGGV